MVEPIGQCTLNLKNEKTGQIYETEFVVLRDECTPLLGSETIQQMDLVKVQYENILSLSVKGTAVLLNKDTIIQQYPDVFQGTGKFKNKYHLTVDSDAVPVIHTPRPIPMGMLTFQFSRAVRNAFWDRQGANKVSSVVRCYKYSYISRIQAKFSSKSH